MLLFPLLFGEETIAQPDPFHCSISVLSPLAPTTSEYPTAQQSDADAHVVAKNWFVPGEPLFGDFAIDQRGPVGFRGMLAVVAAVLPLNGKAWLSTKSEPPEMPLIALDGFAAKLSIASRTPAEPRAKASKTRGIKNPDGSAEISFIALFRRRL
jgi:hypothetical protein